MNKRHPYVLIHRSSFIVHRSRWLLVLALAAPSAGCLGFLHGVKAPDREAARPCQDIPECRRDHVHVFLIDGLDPLGCANLRGVGDYVSSLGFRNTHYGQFWDADRFGDEIRRIHGEDPNARFAVVGFSLGARMARGLVESLRENNVSVDLLVYLDGKGLMYLSSETPTNAARVVNARGPGVVWTAPPLKGAEDLSLDGVWHYGVPTHPRTLASLTRELATVAAAAPAEAKGEAPPAATAAAP